MPCPGGLFPSILNRRWFLLAINSGWFLKIDFTGLLNFSINFFQGGLSILLERWWRGLIGKRVRFFKVTVGLFLLLFTNCSVQNCLRPARNRGQSPSCPVWWDPWCKSSLIWTKCIHSWLGLWFQKGSVQSSFGWSPGRWKLRVNCRP